MMVCWEEVGLETDAVEELDDLDLQIINLLQEDSRLSFKKMAGKTWSVGRDGVQPHKNLGAEETNRKIFDHGRPGKSWIWFNGSHSDPSRGATSSQG